MSTTRVRFAPSPTGRFHIGSARTALFNWLYARHTGGVFILRLEDTDAARNTPESVAAIYDAMEWLKLDFDEGPQRGGGGKGWHGPYRQSERGPLYQQAVEKLLSSGHAYEDEGAVKFRLPKGPQVVRDAICGEVTFGELPEGDLVIRRSNGAPVFHLVNVVDDAAMEVTHVIRGEDHLPNTPKHLALFGALGEKPPVYAHIPLILNPVGTKMSKRDEGAAIEDYRNWGYLPEAVVNYLCLLGWTPPEGKDVVELGEVVRRFDLPDVNRSNARFDPDKLLWMNGEYQKRLTPGEFACRVWPLLERAGLVGAETDRAWAEAVIGLFREKVRSPAEVPLQSAYFFKEDYPVEDKAAAKLAEPAAPELLGVMGARLQALEPYTAEAIEGLFKKLAEERGLKLGALMAPCRAAVSGMAGGPSLYHTLELLGRERCVRRLGAAAGS